jgi:multidrug efflux pump subunit AcrA (membrane-fusion protein)
MVPGFRSDKPGKSPFMDMQLVPVYDDATAQGGMPIVSVRPEITHNLGVRTDKVTRRGLLLAVPREALIRTGTRTALVLALGEGRFQPVEVIAGQESGDWIEIRQGVKDGDVVVTSGQFLIDSEANVRASFQRLAPVEK